MLRGNKVLYMNNNQSFYVKLKQENIVSGQIILPQQYNLLYCQKCGYKTMVYYGLFGVSHNTELRSICADCLQVTKSFQQEYPKETEILMDWKKDEKWKNVGDG